MNEVEASQSREDLALKIVGLSKSYRKFMCWNSVGDVKALQNFYFSGKHGSIIALLGHNGGMFHVNLC
jgi:ABC-type multidrug transport system ATPase subunit